MRGLNERSIIKLSAREIDSFSERLDEILEQLKVERQNKLRIRLFIEEALLRYREHFGHDCQVQTIISKKFGKPFVQIELEGDVFNPLNKTETELNDWSSSILTSVGIHMQYSYSGNKNILRINIPSQGMNPVVRLFIFLALGLLCGFLLRTLLPAADADDISNAFFIPVFDLWSRILNLISGPVIMFMVMTTVLGFGSMHGKGANSKLVVCRYFAISAVIAAISVLIVILILRINITAEQLSESTLANVLNEIFKFVPYELISPIVYADTPQLIFLGFVLGIVLHMLRGQADALISVVQQINKVCLMLCEWISWLVPIFTAVLIALEIAGGGFSLLIEIWKPFLLSLALIILAAAFVIVYMAIKKKVHVSVLISKVWDPLILTIKTGSLNSSYGLTEKYCNRFMGIDLEFTRISLSHGLVLYMPANIQGAVIFTVFAASKYNVSVSWLWFVIAIILTAVLMIAAPPVPGVTLLVYIAVFGQLGIPSEALIPGMVFDIVLGIFSTAFNQLMLQLEMIEEADRVGFINKDKLRMPIGKTDK